MDEEFWQQFWRVTRAFESTREFQDWCRKVYAANKDVVQEFVRWRTLFNIKPGSSPDAGLAFMIYKLKEYHPLRWKHILRFIMRKASSLPPGLYETYLLLLIKKYELKNINEMLAGAKTMVYPGNILRRRTGEIQVYIQYVIKYLKKGEIKGLLSPPPDILPEWYFVARPEYKFYAEEHLEAVLQPLFEKELAEGNKKLQLLNELHTILQKHAWNAPFIAESKELLRELAVKVEIENRLRAEMKKMIDLKQAEKQSLRIQLMVREQQKKAELVTKVLRRGQAIPNKEMHQRVFSLLTELQELLKE